MIEKIGKWEGDNVNIFKCFFLVFVNIMLYRVILDFSLCRIMYVEFMVVLF